MPEEQNQTLQSPGASIADDFYGKPEPAPEPPAEEKPQAPEPPPVEGTPPASEETPPDTIPPGDESTQDPGQEEEQTDQGTSDEAAATGDTEEVEVTTLEMLADHLETDPEWLRGLTVTEKVNGEDVEIKLSDALQTHRMVTAADQVLENAKTRSKEIMDATNQEKESIVSTVVTLNALLEEAEAMSGNMTDEQWARLRREDPAEYSARREEQRERQAKIDDLRQRAVQAYGSMGTQMTEAQRARRQQNLPVEREIFMEMVPEWKDEAVARRESSEIAEYLQTKGHTPEEIEVAAYNGKLLAYVRNSMLYERGRQKIATGKKKVVKIPKVMKPGAAPVGEQKPTADKDDPVSILYGPS